MKPKLKPAHAKARALLEKLQALAERGIDGEKAVARKKLARLKARFDFEAPAPDQTPDLFAGHFRQASTVRPVFSFGLDELDVANSVKWAIESATGIRCLYRDKTLVAEAAPATARRLEEIAIHIASSFRVLIDKFNTVEAVSAKDRGVFVMGLYDGMMNDTRSVGQSLPSRPGPSPKKQRGRKRATTATAAASPGTAGLHVHPYTLGVSLGRQIRFSAPVQQLAAELEAAAAKWLAQKHETAEH